MREYDDMYFMPLTLTLSRRERVICNMAQGLLTVLT